MLRDHSIAHVEQAGKQIQLRFLGVWLPRLCTNNGGILVWPSDDAELFTCQLMLGCIYKLSYVTCIHMDKRPYTTIGHNPTLRAYSLKG